MIRLQRKTNREIKEYNTWKEAFLDTDKDKHRVLVETGTYANRKTEGIIHALKEIFKLPCDKKTNTTKTKDITEMIEKLYEEIPQEDKDRLSNELKRKESQKKAEKEE